MCFRWFLLISVAIFTGCSTSSISRMINGEEGYPQDTFRFSRVDYMKDLSSPWDLAFLSDGTLFYTEKCEGLSIRYTNGETKRLFGNAGSLLVAKDFFCMGQSGMLGVAIDPDFSQNRYLYVYMSSNLFPNEGTNRVVRLKLNSSLKGIVEREDIVKDIPFKNKDNDWGGAGSHSGGRLRFGPDGYLYITTGDNHNGKLPQDLHRLGGKVLRVDRNGKAAPENNHFVSGDPRIFTYGHRNVQGITFHPRTKEVFISEHGPRHNDEVTKLIPGGNGGWSPAPEENVECKSDYCGYTSNKRDGSPTPMTDYKRFPEAMKPIWTNNGKSQGTGPSTFISGEKWGEWNGKLLVGIMGYALLAVLELDQDGNLKGVTYPELPRERMRSLVQGFDGNLYVATDSGNIWKISPAGE